jgi:hypothetical protein
VLIAQLADAIQQASPGSVDDVAAKWVDLYWEEYQRHQLILRCHELSEKQPYDASKGGDPQVRTEDEEREYHYLRQNLVVGFCLGGYIRDERTPTAFEIIFDPTGPKPSPEPLSLPDMRAWGAPNMINRLIRGIDDGIVADILGSGKWTGTEEELNAILVQHVLAHPILPIRDAIDFVHTCVYSTIKAFKFANLSPICGGPIELAVITADRHFRWVRHKHLHSAISEGEH